MHDQHHVKTLSGVTVTLIASQVKEVAFTLLHPGPGYQVAVFGMSHQGDMKLEANAQECADLKQWLNDSDVFIKNGYGRWFRAKTGKPGNKPAPLPLHELRPETHEAIREAVQVEVAKQLAEIGKWGQRDVGGPWKGSEPRRLMVPPISLPVEDVPREGQTPYGYVVGHLSLVALECLRDVVSHASDIRDALRARLDEAEQDDCDAAVIDAEPENVGDENRSYWRHQQVVFNRMVEQATEALAVHDKVNPKPETRPLTGTLERIEPQDIMNYPTKNSTGPITARDLAEQYNHDWAGATWTIENGRTTYTWPDGESK